MSQKFFTGRRAAVLVRFLRNRLGRSTATQRRSAGRHLPIEPLEDRRLLSVVTPAASTGTVTTKSIGAVVSKTLNQGVETLPGGIKPVSTVTVSGTNGGDPKAPTPVITILGATGYGPHAVFVHAINSTLAAGTPLTARYTWDFGDPGSPHDTLVGWNAAHVYDKPGSYTITLTLTNEIGKTRTLTATVNVGATLTRTIYVDAVLGNDKNSGLSPTAAVKSVPAALKLMGNNTQMLFHAGQTFNVFSSMNMPYQNMLLGSYGTGAQPVLMRQAGVGASVMSFLASTTNVVIQDLTFDSPFKPVNNIANKPPADGIFPSGSDIVIRRCTFLNLDNAVDEDRNPQGTLIEDCTAPSPTGLRGCFIWGQGTDQVYLNNTVANSTREHNIRTVWVVRELIDGNHLTNLNRQNVDPQDYSKGTIDVHRGSFAYVSNNWTYGGELRVGPRNGPAAVPGDTTQWCVVEGNHTFGHCFQIYPGTYHVMIRNNVFTEDNDCCVNVVTSNAAGDNIQDITFANNTGVTNSVGGEMFNITKGGATGSISLINNLWLAPNVIPGMHATAAVNILDKTGAVLKISTNNVWEAPKSFNPYAHGGDMLIWPTWAPPNGYYTPAAWNALPFVATDFFSQTAITSNYTPVAGSLASTAGIDTPGVFVDINGKLRPTNGHITAGALQT